MSITRLGDQLPHAIIYIVPSRGRPGNIAELLDAWRDTYLGAAGVIVAVDNDDPELAGYLDLEWQANAAFARLYVGDRLRLGGTLNAIAPAIAAGRLAVGFMGDDHRPRTSGWDLELGGSLRDVRAVGRFGVVYGNDLVQRSALPTAVALDADIVLELGYFVPPGATHLYLDNYWLELGRRIHGLRYRDDVIIEHCHPIAGTAEPDAGYAEVNHPDLYAADEARFRRWLELEADDAVDALAARAATLEAAR